jgi:hypothetical protein
MASKWILPLSFAVSHPPENRAHQQFRKYFHQSRTHLKGSGRSCCPSAEMDSQSLSSPFWNEIARRSLQSATFFFMARGIRQSSGNRELVSDSFRCQVRLFLNLHQIVEFIAPPIEKRCGD